MRFWTVDHINDGFIIISALFEHIYVATIIRLTKKVGSYFFHIYAQQNHIQTQPDRRDYNIFFLYVPLICGSQPVE